MDPDEHEYENTTDLRVIFQRAGLDAVYQIGRDDGAGDERTEWADYFESWGSTVGSRPFTQGAVVTALRGPRPFGTEAAAS